MVGAHVQRQGEATVGREEAKPDDDSLQPKRPSGLMARGKGPKARGMRRAVGPKAKGQDNRNHNFHTQFPELCVHTGGARGETTKSVWCARLGLRRKGPRAYNLNHQ